MDFYTKMYPKKSNEELLKVGRWVTLSIMIIATAWAPQIVHFEKLWDYLQQALSWFCPPVLALFIMGLFWKGANSRGALWCIVVGTFVSVLSIVFNSAEWKPHFLYMTGIHFGICCAAMVVGSMMGTGKTAAELAQVVWTPAEYHAESKELEGLPWWKNYRYQGAILVVLVILILLAY